MRWRLSVVLVLCALSASADAALRVTRAPKSRLTYRGRQSSKLRNPPKRPLAARDVFVTTKGFASSHRFRVLQPRANEFQLVDFGRARQTSRIDARPGLAGTRHVLVTRAEAPIRLSVVTAFDGVWISAPEGDIGLAEILKTRLLLGHKGAVTVRENNALSAHVVAGSERETSLNP